MVVVDVVDVGLDKLVALNAVDGTQAYVTPETEVVPNEKPLEFCVQDIVPSKPALATGMAFIVNKAAVVTCAQPAVAGIV